jgi:hypothetical protein
MAAEVQFRQIAVRSDLSETDCIALACMGDALVSEKDNHQANADKQHKFQPIADPHRPAAVNIPGVVGRHDSSFQLQIVRAISLPTAAFSAKDRYLPSITAC